MKKNKLSKIHMMLAGAVALNVVLGVVYFFAFQAIEKFSNDIVVKEKDTSHMVQKYTDTKQFAGLIKEIEPAQGTLKKYFIDQEEYLSFLEYLKSLPSIAGVKTTIALVSVSSGFQFNITYEGAFDDVLYFVALIESLPYNTTVNDVFLEEATPGGNVWRGSMSITFPGSGV